MRSAQLISLALLIVGTGAGAQNRINPARQILWPDCRPGEAYLPVTNACALLNPASGLGGLPVGWVVSGLGTAQVVTAPGGIAIGSPVSTPTITLQNGNGIFSGTVLASNIPAGANRSSIITFGDSITQGTGATTFQTPGVNGQPVSYPALTGYFAAGVSPNGPTAYAFKLLADYGNSGINAGRGGDQATDMGFRVVQLTHPTVANNPVTTMLISTNDVSRYGTNTNQQDTFTKALMFSAAWNAIPDVAKVLANSSNCTTTGAWSADPTGIPIPFGTVPGARYTTVSGATLTCTVTTYAPVLYLMYQKSDGWAGAASVQIDGVAAPGPDANLIFYGLGGSTISTANGSVSSLSLARYTGIAAGTHTVTITVTSANGNTAKIVALASPYAASPGTAAPPAVYVGGTPWDNADAREPASGQYNTIITNSIATLTADGLPVHFVDVRACMNSTTDYTGRTDANGKVWAASYLLPLHPGDGGHNALYQCFHNAISPQILPTQAFSIYGGPYGAIDGSLSTPSSLTGDTTSAVTALFIHNWATPSLSALNMQSAGSHSMTFGQWGSGYGSGLAGVTGFIDNTKQQFVWNTNTNGDFCAMTATSWGTPNANICAGSSFHVSGGLNGSGYLVGIGTNTPGVTNGVTGPVTTGSTLQVDNVGAGFNSQVIIQTSVGGVPILHLTNMQATSGQRDWSLYHSGSSLVIGNANDAETSTTPQVTISIAGTTFSQPITVPSCTGCGGGGGGGITDASISIASFAIPATTCYGSTGSTTPATVAMTGLTTAMAVFPSFTGNASAITGWGASGGLSLMAWPSASNVASYLVCNATSGSITGGAITLLLGAQ